MHSFQGKKTSFHYDGDCTGGCIIIKKIDGDMISIDDILDFAEHIKQNRKEREDET